MRKLFATAVICLLVAQVGCDPCDLDEASAECQQQRSMTVTVELQSALIGPGKLDHTSWDGNGEMVSTEIWSNLASALAGASPYTAAAGLLVNPVLAGTRAPDAMGTARLDIGQSVGQPLILADASSNIEDSYSPSWATPALWGNVPLDQNVRIKVDLTDEDLLNHDSIGVAEINSSHLVDALAAGKVYHVPVADQTNQQILFLGISVRQ
jgi:hypothetical protein